MECTDPLHLAPRYSLARGPFLAALLCTLQALSVGLCWGQRDSAATESESGAAASFWQRGDAHRDDDLIGLAPMDASLHGAEHLSQFLDDWYELLFEASGRDPENGRPIEVLHFGGSHVQAGRIGWAFRQRLQEDRPGVVAGSGIHAPHRLMGSNGPPERGWSSPEPWSGQSCANRRHRGNWGITGVEAQSAMPAAVSCWNGDPAGADCTSEIRVWSRPDSAITWQPQLPPQWKSDTAALPLAGVAHWSGPAHGSAPDTLTLQPTSDGEPVLQGVEWVPANAGFVFHDLGANGANSTSWMRNPHFKAQLQAVSADLVILAWGINDAHMAQNRFDSGRFARHYGALIDTIRSAQPGAEILLVTNNDSHYRHRHNPNAESVRQAMLDLVAQREVACWDLYAHLGGKGSIDALNSAGFAASDRLHFRKDGYILIGELLYELLVRAAIHHWNDTP